MPQISKTTKTAAKTKTSTRAADSWLDGKDAKSSTPRKATRKVAAKKTPAKKVVARKAPAKAVRKSPEKKVTARKTRKPRPPKAALVVKPIRTKLGRTDLVEHLSTTSGQDKTAVKAVMEALKVTMLAHIAPRGAGEFVLPGMFKIATRKVPAKKVAAIKKGTEVRNPRTGETYAHAGRAAFTKPATVKVRIRPMKAMKDMAIGA